MHNALLAKQVYVSPFWSPSEIEPITLVQWAIHEKLTLTRTVALQRAQSAQEPMNEFSSDCLTTICFLTLITLCNLKRKAGRGRGVSCGSNLLKGTTGVKP